jgi:hypothetical protein
MMCMHCDCSWCEVLCTARPGGVCSTSCVHSGIISGVEHCGVGPGCDVVTWHCVASSQVLITAAWLGAVPGTEGSASTGSSRLWL